MQKTRFEIEHKLRRERRAKKKKAREQVEREQNRVIRSSRRSRLEDSSKSKAIDELKAKRSAGETSSGLPSHNTQACLNGLKLEEATHVTVSGPTVCRVLGFTCKKVVLSKD